VSVIRADVVLTGNTISDVEGAGIVFLTSTGTVASNIIEGPARAGITLVESGEGELTVTENQVSDAVGVGIAVLTSNANVVNNTVVRTIVSFEDGLGDGILFASGSSGLIVGNDVRDSAYNGIRFVDGVTATIEGNRVSGSGLAAIHQDCGPYEPSQVTIGDNELEGEVSLCD
jgi:parallel beta-helix repeat protein